MRKRVILAAICVAAVSLCQGVDYSSLEGKCGAALKAAVKEIASPHTVISYGDATWQAFATSDVRMVDGKEAWFDMYSNRLVYTANGHAGMNVEHAVANSWWGGKRNDAYKDLHHLNPSDADANNRKNNNPLGLINGTPAWSNGVSAVGAPMYGLGGGATSVFEPAEWFKGDFARAYFYIFTVYDDIEWEEAPACMYDLTTYPTLKPWAYEMLLDWAEKDPVDTRENGRNLAVAQIQKNENPFVAIPNLAEYIWGSKKDTPLHIADAMYEPVDRPEAPAFEGYDIAAINTWTGRWAEATDIIIEAAEGTASIYYTLTDSDEYQLYENGIHLGEPAESGMNLVVKAYAVGSGPMELRSPVATLTLTSVKGSDDDYKNARWELVNPGENVTEDDLYIICSESSNEVMGAESKSTSSSGYIISAGTVYPDNNVITLLPDDAAVVKFTSDGGSQYYVGINDLMMNHKGYLFSSVSKKVSIASTGCSVGVKVEDAGTLTIDFGSSIGTLQYNAQQPRFSVYTSNQKKLNLYKFAGWPISSCKGPDFLNESEPVRIFSIQGMEMNCEETSLPAGIYIKVSSGGKSEKIIRK